MASGLELTFLSLPVSHSPPWAVSGLALPYHWLPGRISDTLLRLWRRRHPWEGAMLGSLVLGGISRFRSNIPSPGANRGGRPPDV
jgi:hypothetical protein